MSNWIWSAETALVFGTLAFIVIFVPALAWQYRRFGALSFRRLIGTALLTMYAVALITYTWLPLPPRSAEWCAVHAQGVHLTPFHMVSDLRLAWSQARSTTAFLTGATFLQIVLNVLLFVPLGVVVRRFFHRGILLATATGLAVSLVIEVTQATGLWFIYPCAYRVADVDDLILNTSGALLGAILAPAVMWWMPHARVLAQSRMEPRPVTAWRRWIGQLIDVALAFGLSLGCVTAGLAVWLLLGYSVDDAPVWALSIISTAIPWLMVFVIPPWRHLAASPGQTAVWLTPVWVRAGKDTHGTLPLRLLRANVTALPWLATSWAGGSLLYLSLAWVIPAVLSIALVPVTRTRRSLSGLLTGAEMRDIRDVVAAERASVPPAVAEVS